MRTVIFFLFLTLLAATVLSPQNGTAAAGENSSRFTLENGVVIDIRTYLMWAVRDNGADISFEAAKSYCEHYSGGGYADWRLPTQDELASLYAQYNDQGYAIARGIHITACCLWSSDSKGSMVGSFDFNYGNRDWGHPMSTIDARVLPVRVHVHLP